MRILIGLLTIASLNATSIGVMAADSRSNSQSDRLPIATLIAKGGLPKKAGHTKASSQLRGFKPQKIQVGKKTFHLGRNDMRKIITKHTVAAHNRKEHPATESFFSKKTKPKQIVKQIRGIFKQHGSKIIANHNTNKKDETYKHQSKKYRIGYDKSHHIPHFYPKR